MRHRATQGDSAIHDDPLVARFYGLLEAEFATDASLPDEVQIDIVHLAQEIVVQVEANASMVRFWHNPHAQETLRKQLIHTLDDRDLFPFEEQAPLADKLMELAKANQSLIASRRR